VAHLLHDTFVQNRPTRPFTPFILSSFLSNSLVHIMISILFKFAALVVCISQVTAGPTVAPPPLGTFGHTAVLYDDTVFIQGGWTTKGAFSDATYAITLKDGSLNNATWLDISSPNEFPRRKFGAAVATEKSMIICGTQDGTQGTAMTCDQLNTIGVKYSILSSSPPKISNRYGMAATSDGIKAYFIGGSNSIKQDIWTMDILTNLSSEEWSTGPDMSGILPRKFHTATWVDAPLNGIVMMGGLADDIVTLPLSPVAVYDPIASKWTSVNLTSVGGAETTRYGHSAVSDRFGKIFVFGGFDRNGAVRNELLVLDTNQPREKWSLEFLSKAPEGRVFHTATLLPDDTMLIVWGQNGSTPNSAQSTYMLYHTLQNVWVTKAPQTFPAMDIGEYKLENGYDPSPRNPNPPLIIGIWVVGGVLLILIIGLALYFCYFKRHRRTPLAPHPGMYPEKDPTTSTSEQQEDKANQIKVPMSGMQRTLDPSYGDRHYVSNDASYNPPGAARNGLGGPGPRVPQFAAVLHGPQNIEGQLRPQYGVDFNAPQYNANSRAPQHIAKPHEPRHEFQYDMDPRAPQYSVDPVNPRVPQFGAHSGALLYAAEPRAP
ncbi:MAG: hypothetical protein J3Q66DRAFT_324442, partial [Benniella sp.]